MMLHPQIQAAWLVLLILIHTEGPALEPANAIGYESLMDPDEGFYAIGHSNRPEEELLHKKHDVRVIEKTLARRLFFFPQHFLS
jgi:hypothetical protein